MRKAMESVFLIVLLVLETCSIVCLAQSPPITDQALHQIAASLQMFVDPVPQIPNLLGYTPGRHGEVHGPGRLTIGMYQTKWKFHRDFPPTTVFAYGTSQATATVPGPTINAIHSVPTYVTWENHLPKNHILPWDPTISAAIAKSGGVPTVVHLHGGVISPANDGSALAWFTANFAEKGPVWSQSTYMYPNAQHAGNLWYHDHALGLTRVNLLAGLIAPYIIRDPAQEAKLNLPSGPEFDRNLFIFDRNFYADGSLYMNRTGSAPEVHPQWQPEYFGHAIIVNGKAWPFMNVQRRKYRFRITNASNARYLNLALTNGLSFTVIGSDGSYLPSPVTSSSILLSTSEIFDVVIDFSLTSASESIMTNDAPYPFPTGNPVDKLSSQVMKFIIQGPPSTPDTSRIPSTLQVHQTAAVAARKASVKRYITLHEYTNAANQPTHLYINGKRFTDPATETPKTGSTEVWEVINLTGDNHPLHIHLAEFQALQSQSLNDPNGDFASCMNVNSDAIACNISSYATGPITPTPAYERTWKNAVKLSPGFVTTVVVKFNLVDNDQPYPFDATADPGYVYHCHILDHEDNEMIRPLMLQR